MSRIGKRPIRIEKDVTVKIADGTSTMKGPQGTTTMKMPAVSLVDVNVGTDEIAVTRKQENAAARREQGLVRALLQNQMTGVATGYKKELDIVGVGYKAEVKGKELHVSVGYASPKVYQIPDNLEIKVEKGVRVYLSSTDKWTVGQAASHIRKIRPPEPYKGKGIRHYEEQIKRKVGKAAVGAGG